MSGVATLTQRYVAAARTGHPDVQVLDTRKTIPGWRELDKYAVRCGGGTNHRTGLFDAVLIKDNHLARVATDRLADELRRRVAAVPAAARFIQVEVDTLAQFEQVCRVDGVDYVLLDNFTLDDMRTARRPPR
jgi:nicotinate-nucleotide pyrophosphorylase (carboxylating)